MRKLQKSLALLLALVMCFSLCLGVMADGEAAAPGYSVTGDYSGKTVILHTNDIHGAVDGYAKIAALKAEFEAAGADVLLIDAGDFIQGTTYVSVSTGATAVALMNAAGYDLATLGNHEFDYGYANLTTILEKAEFDVTSNIKYNGENVYDAAVTLDTVAGSIAFIGLTTPETATKAHPAKIQGVTFPAAEALYTGTQAVVDSLDADVVIALAHLGVDDSSAPNRSYDLWNNITGVDFVIDGHSHTVMTEGANGEPIQSTGTKAAYVGLIVVGKSGIESNELIDLSTYTGSDETVKALSDSIISEIETIYGTTFATTEVLLDGNRAPGVRTQETNLGDLIADAILWQATKDGGLPVDLENVVAITNGGGIRATIQAGDITMNDINTVLPFGNTVAFVYVTGAELLEVLEASTFCTPVSVGAFPQTAGIEYTLDVGVAYDQGEQYPGTTYYAPASINRISIQSINGQPFDESATYCVVTNDFLAAGGDTYYAFTVAENVIDTGIPMDEAVVNYITEELDGVVTAAQYGDADDGLTIVDSSAVTVLYTNDIHTYITKSLGYAEIAALKDSYENVLLVDAGDHIQGTAYGSMDNGKTIIDLMNAAGYDLATLGNHEFDYGMDGTMNVIEWADFPYVSANFYNEKNGVAGDTVLNAYEVFEVGGIKIAFVGITTPESFTKSTPKYFQDENGNYIYGIAGGDDGSALYAAVQKAIDAASLEADYVIALGHLGDDKSSQPWTSEELIANTTGLDAFIDGHSHSTVPMKTVTDKDGNSVVLTQTGEYFNAIGKMSISVANGTITTELLTSVDVTPDAEVKAISDAWVAEIEAELGQIIGYAEVTLDNYDADGNRLVRIQETNSGDFAADALYYLFDGMGLDVDVAIMNGGGVRNGALTGELSYNSMKLIHTFGNVACLQTVTGQQIIDALEWGARQAPDVQVGGFLHVSGLKYTVDASVESTVQMDDKGVWTGAPTGEYRVKDVQVYNKETNAWEAIDPAAKYNLAGYNYTLRDLGDGFAMFDGAVNVLDYVMTDYMVLANYVQGFENATVGATNSPLNAKYSGFGSDYSTVDGSGRITIKAGAGEEEDGVATVGGLDNNLWTTKYGNLYCDMKVESFFNLGYSLGDLVTVKFLDQELVLPVVPTYSYVDSGKPAIIATVTETGAPTGYLSFAINMGNFTETYGIAKKCTDADGNWWFEAFEGVSFPMDITFEMYEKEGYMAEYLLHELSRTNNREDYADLTDEQFANFRAIIEGVLYRSSSPINPELNRNTYADAAIENAGVTVIMNLADSAESAAAYEGFADTYYADQKVIYLNLGVDFAEDSFKAGLAKGLRFFAENEGVYMVHCTEGKDRAGFVSALLECLMGYSYEEVVADYMVTYYNYYGVEPGTEKYTAIANSNIIKSLQNAFGVEDLSKADLAVEAVEYISSLGLTDAEIAQLVLNLGAEIPFVDVEGHWAYEYIATLYSEGIVNGKTLVTFVPEEQLTWGQALKMLLVSTDTMEAATVTGNGWAQPYIDKAIELGLVESVVYSDYISRVEFCALAAELFGLEAKGSSPFSDTNDASVIALYEAGILDGMGDGTFEPDSTLTRAQIAKIIALFIAE